MEIENCNFDATKQQTIMTDGCKSENSDLEDIVPAKEISVETLINENEDYKFSEVLLPSNDTTTNEFTHCAVHIPYILNGELYKIQNKDGENVTVKCINCPPDRLYRGSVRSTGNFHMHIKRRHPDLIEKLHEMKINALLERRDRHMKSRSRSTTQNRIFKRSINSHISSSSNGFKVPQQLVSHMSHNSSQHKKLKTAFKQRHLMQQQQQQQQQQQLKQLQEANEDLKTTEDKEFQRHNNNLSPLTTNEQQQQQDSSEFSKFFNQQNHLHSTPISFIKRENDITNINVDEPLDLRLKKSKNTIDDSIQEKVSFKNFKNNDYLKLNGNKSIEQLQLKNLNLRHLPVNENVDTNSTSSANLSITPDAIYSTDDAANIMNVLTLVNNTCQGVHEALQDIKTIQKNLLLLEYAKAKHLHPLLDFNLCLR